MKKTKLPTPKPTINRKQIWTGASDYGYDKKGKPDSPLKKVRGKGRK